MNKVIIKLIDVNTIKNNLNKILEAIDQQYIDKANKFLKEKDRLLSLGGSYLISKYLDSKDISYNENGKPYIDGIFFNLSHSSDIVILGISDNREIGIDIEEINQENLKAIEYITKDRLSLNEMFNLWTNKESLIKCIGLNMSIIEEVPGLPIEGSREYKEKYYYTKSLNCDNYSLSITLVGKEPFEYHIDILDNNSFN